MKKKLYIDIDGVIGDLVAAILSFSFRAELINPYIYNIEFMFDNVSQDVVLMPELYNKRNFRLYPFVGEVLRRLEALGFEILFLSARPTNSREQTLVTLKQLELYNIYWEFRIGLSGKDKLITIRDDILLNDIDRAFVIEDNPQFIMDMAGWYVRHPELKDILTTLVYLQTYNTGEQGLIHMLPEFRGVMNWKHIENEVTKP